MADRKIPLLITGGMPEYLMENILTDGYNMQHIENPTDEELAAAEVIVGFPPVPRLSSAANLKWLQIPWSGADGYADHPDFPGHVLLTNATGAFGRPIAEYAFAAVFSLMRRFHQYRDVQKEMKNASYIPELSLLLRFNGVACAYGQIINNPSGHYLVNFGVIPEFQGQGFSHILLDELLERAVTMGLNHIMLEVYEDNIRAVRLYEKHGFKRFYNKCMWIYQKGEALAAGPVQA